MKYESCYWFLPIDILKKTFLQVFDLSHSVQRFFTGFIYYFHSAKSFDTPAKICLKWSCYFFLALDPIAKDPVLSKPAKISLKIFSKWAIRKNYIRKIFQNNFEKINVKKIMQNPFSLKHKLSRSSEISGCALFFIASVRFWVILL